MEQDLGGPGEDFGFAQSEVGAKGSLGRGGRRPDSQAPPGGRCGRTDWGRAGAPPDSVLTGAL